jgi:ankyrin repeat protein
MRSREDQAVSATRRRSKSQSHLLRYWTACHPDWRLSSATSLLDLGVDVNALGGYYGTCLIAASSYGVEELVRLFLDRGAEVHHRSERYGTALEAAEAAGHQDIYNLLWLAMQ